MSRELERRGLASRLVLQVHDELVLECPDDELDACLPLLRDAMCGALDLDPPLEVETGRRRRLGGGQVLSSGRVARRLPSVLYSAGFGPLRSAGLSHL